MPKKTEKRKSEPMHSQGEAHDLTLKFYGPFQWCASAPAKSVFGAAQSGEQGVYVWTVLTRQGEIALHVGLTTRSFAWRMQEHLKEQLSGMYAILNPVSLRHGKLEFLWKGMYWSDHEASLGDFALRLPKLAPDLVRYIRMSRFYIAPMKLRRRLLERTEAAIANGFCSRASICKEFLEGKRYRPRRQRENPVRLRCLWPRPIVGVPRNLEV